LEVRAQCRKSGQNAEAARIWTSTTQWTDPPRKQRATPRARVTVRFLAYSLGFARPPLRLT